MAWIHGSVKLYQQGHKVPSTVPPHILHDYADADVDVDVQRMIAASAISGGPFSEHQSKRSRPSEPAVQPANYTAATLDRHYFQ